MAENQSDPQNSPQAQIGSILNKPAAPAEDKPIDLNQLVFKTMPKGYPVPKDYTPPAQTVMPKPVQVGSVTAGPASQVPTPVMPVAGKSHKVLLWVVLLILILLVAGIMAYFLLVNKKPVSTPVASIPATESTQTTPTTPPVATTSTIDPAWLTKYFPTYVVNGACSAENQATCGDSADPDFDGLTNLQEYQAKTDPTNPDTDGDGIADGDEVNVFNINPLTAHSSGNLNYSDAGDLKSKYNSTAKALFTDTDLVRIAAAIRQYGLHSPTTKTLDQSTIEFYTNYKSTSSTTATAAQ